MTRPSARGAAKPPLYLTSTFVYPLGPARQGRPPDLLRGPATEARPAEPAYIYIRLGHPNLDMVEKAAGGPGRRGGRGRLLQRHGGDLDHR